MTMFQWVAIFLISFNVLQNILSFTMAQAWISKNKHFFRVGESVFVHLPTEKNYLD